MLVKNSKGVQNVARIYPKILAGLNVVGKSPEVCFWTYFDELNPNMKSVCPRKYLIVRYQSCRVCLSATVVHKLKNLAMEIFAKAYDGFTLQADPKTLNIIFNTFMNADGANAERDKPRETNSFDYSGPDENPRTEFRMDIDDAG